MFVVFVDQACNANIYTHKFIITCIACCRKACYFAKLKSAKTFPKCISAKVYTLEIYTRYTIVITHQGPPLATSQSSSVNHEDTADGTGAAPHYGD